MFYKNRVIFLVVLLISGLTGCSSDGGGNSGGESDGLFFEFKIDDGPLQRIEITEAQASDIMGYYSIGNNETVILAPLEKVDSSTYLKVFDFRYSGMGTGAQTVTNASYWLNDGTNTLYSHEPNSSSNAMLNITAYGEMAQPIAGEFDFILCKDTSTCTESMSIQGSFSVRRQPDR